MTSTITRPLVGGRILPVRCWYCNRYLSHLSGDLMKGDAKTIGADYPYCCKSFLVTTKDSI